MLVTEIIPERKGRSPGDVPMKLPKSWAKKMPCQNPPPKTRQIIL